MTKAFYDVEGVRVDVEDVVARAAIDGESFLRAWLDSTTAREGIEPDTKEMLTRTSQSLADRLDYWAFVCASHDWFTKLQQRPVGATLDSALTDFGDEKEIWNALKAEIAGHYTLSDLSLHSFLQELDLRAKEKPAPKGAVRCLTIASSKGMEFKHVFLIGLVEDELPGYYARKKGDDTDDMREERRNCFVAITRAEDQLTLTYSDTYGGYPKQPSRFLTEMGFKIGS